MSDIFLSGSGSSGTFGIDILTEKKIKCNKCRLLFDFNLKKCPFCKSLNKNNKGG